MKRRNNFVKFKCVKYSKSEIFCCFDYIKLQNSPLQLVLDITRLTIGTQLSIYASLFYMPCIFYTLYNMVLIANTEIGLDPKIVL